MEFVVPHLSGLAVTLVVENSSLFSNKPSCYKTCSNGIPQDSVLDPVLFLIYINDIVRAINKLKYILFAGGTTIYLQVNNL